MRIVLIVLGIIVVIALIYVFVLKPKADAALVAAGAQAGANSAVAPTSAYLPGSAEAALATAKHPIVCKTKCTAFHPFNRSKRTACEAKCKQTGVVS